MGEGVKFNSQMCQSGEHHTTKLAAVEMCQSFMFSSVNIRVTLAASIQQTLVAWTADHQSLERTKTEPKPLVSQN